MYKQAKTANDYLVQRYQINPKTSCWEWTFEKDKDEEIYSYKGKETSFKTANRFGISFSRVCQIWRKEVDFNRKPKREGEGITKASGVRDLEEVPGAN